MTPYIQLNGENSTLENWKKMLIGNNLESFAAFAYVTDSGVAKLKMNIGDEFDNIRRCRWLFSIDYGRSQPTALKKLNEFRNSEIRIFDADYVLGSKYFKPRNSCHLKTALTLNADGSPCQQIVGSGNLSGNGLVSAVEAGCLIDYKAISEKISSKVIEKLETMWQNSTPLSEIIQDYEEKYSSVVTPSSLGIDPSEAKESNLFWIDIGYVTKNRGPKKPGNQFDLPRDSHIHLGLKKVCAPLRNSILGELNIKTVDGRIVTRALRFGNNEMEKLTLPIPENYGYDSYDGKILTFTVENNELILEAFEPEDFYRIYTRRINSVREMRSGRKYGTIS